MVAIDISKRLPLCQALVAKGLLSGKRRERVTCMPVLRQRAENAAKRKKLTGMLTT